MCVFERASQLSSLARGCLPLRPARSVDGNEGIDGNKGGALRESHCARCAGGNACAFIPTVPSLPGIS